MFCKLIHGDALGELASLIDNNIKVDAIITDPPYGTTACKWDNIIPFNIMWEKLKLLRTDKAPIVLFGSEPFSSYLRLSNIKEYKYDWVWEKNTGTNFFHCSRMPIRYTELISVFFKNSTYYYPQKTTDHVPTNSGKGRNTGNIYSGKLKVDYEGGDTTRYPKNILRFKTVNNYKRFHPTEKPVDLLEYLVKTYTKENETILDFTMGSGSTGLACKNLNRNFIGIEKDEKYFKIAKERLRG